MLREIYDMTKEIIDQLMVIGRMTDSIEELKDRMDIVEREIRVVRDTAITIERHARDIKLLMIMALAFGIVGFWVLIYFIS